MHGVGLGSAAGRLDLKQECPTCMMPWRDAYSRANLRNGTNFIELMNKLNELI